MASKEKRAPVKETVGALRYCFGTLNEDGSFSGEYESDVIETKVAKTVKVTQNGDSTTVYASGETYDEVSDITSVDNEVEVVAFPADDIAKMRGEAVSTAGLIFKGGSKERPYFAFGKTVKMRQGHQRFVWYPKCKLISNSDDINTKEESFSEQNDTITIRAYPFDDKGNCQVEWDSTVKAIEGLTEEKFFSKVIMQDSDLTKVVAG